MPELPEVEVTRHGLLPRIPNRKVVEIWWSGKRLRTPMPCSLLQSSIAKQQFTAIDRRAKYLLFRMTNGAVLLIHLGMTGKLAILPKETPRHRHDHLALTLDNATELRFNDTRRFGSIGVWPPDKANLLEKEFNTREGVEPLGEEFTAERMVKLASTRKVGIKAFLMNSRLISGVGNIYANESLFLAEIHPETPARDLSSKQWQRLIASCAKTLQQAIEAGGSTISDFLGSSGQPGYFQLRLNVYGKKDAPCPRCGTSITKTTVAGRATFYCSHCQKKPPQTKVAKRRHHNKP